MKNNVVGLINTKPSLAHKALNTIYHGKTFAVVNGERIETFYKTERGAKGYIKREENFSYYCEMTFQLVYPNKNMEIIQINEEDILNPSDSCQMWYDYIKNNWESAFSYNEFLVSAKYYAVNEKVMQLLEKIVNELNETNGFTLIEKYEKTQPAEVEAAAAAVEEVSNNVSAEAEMTLNEELNGVEIRFDDKPSENVRNVLKENGFRWSKHNKCWYAKQSEKAILLAESIVSASNDTTEQPMEEVVHEDNNKYINIENDNNKIKVKEFLFVWSESNKIEDGQIVNSFDEANTLITKAAAVAPNDGTYDKTKFVVTYENGQKYEGRFDIQRQHMFQPKPLQNHMADFIYHMMEEGQRKDDCKNFLEGYELIEDCEDLKEKRNNGMVINAENRFRKKREQDDLLEAISHFEKNIVPYVTREDLLTLAGLEGDKEKFEDAFNKLLLKAAIEQAKRDLLES